MGWDLTIDIDIISIDLFVWRNQNSRCLESKQPLKPFESAAREPNDKFLLLNSWIVFEPLATDEYLLLSFDFDVENEISYKRNTKGNNSLYFILDCFFKGFIPTYKCICIFSAYSRVGKIVAKRLGICFWFFVCKERWMNCTYWTNR